MATKERRAPFIAEQQKFSTQKFMSYCVVLLFTAVTSWILSYGTSEQKSIIIQTIIGLMIGVVAFWIGSSKGSADKEAELQQIRKAETPQVTDSNTVAAAKETVAVAKTTVLVAEDAQK